jgi:Predicted glycosyltransferase
MQEDYDLQAGDSILIEMKYGTDEAKCKSKVEYLLRDNSLLITWPILNARYVQLTLGMDVKVIYTGSDIQFFYEAKIVEQVDYEKKSLIRVKLISDKRKYQQRNSYRLELSVPVTVMVNKNTGINVRKKAYQMVTSDLSVGGMRLNSDNPIEKDTRIDVSLRIPGIENKIIHGIVTRSVQLMTTYEIGIQFLAMEPKVREIIVSYIFRKQRQVLKGM